MGYFMSSDLATRTNHRLVPDVSRVVAKLFIPGEETRRGTSRAGAVMARILALDEAEVCALVQAVVADFGDRHRDLTSIQLGHFDIVTREIRVDEELTVERRILIGACFTHEYSPEGAALFNPSMVAHPDQSGLRPGELRFVMSVRCVGEGHLSSIGFRTGVLGPDRSVVVDVPEPFLAIGTSQPGAYRLRPFLSRLTDLGVDEHTVQVLLGGLADTFTPDELNAAIAEVHEHTLHRERVQVAIEQVHQVAFATYDIEFPEDTALSGRLLWPSAPVERNGMEDARLVRLQEDDGSVTYLAPYTAYDGARIASHLLSTEDFRRFRVAPMSGQAARSKGLAIFPRRIQGRYAALSRWDRENLCMAYSDDGIIWEDSTILQTPEYGWDLIQVGNGGSPIELPRGWLVLTHGVGPMRQYALGAMLLDLADPAIVLARLPGPLLTPRADERDGYVPNVVYTCGALLHAGCLTIPYGISDGAIGFAQVDVDELVSRMTPEPR
jgi:predicted GH43/DUF377 family glycosyl hydrolase